MLESEMRQATLSQIKLITDDLGLRTVERAHEMIETANLEEHQYFTELEYGTVAPATMATIFIGRRWALATNFLDRLLRCMQLINAPEWGLSMNEVALFRFLIGLNVMEELGYEIDGKGTISGSHRNAHILMFDKMLEKLGASKGDIAAYVPRECDRATKAVFDDCSDSLPRLLAAMATIEDFLSRAAPHTGRYFQKMKGETAQYTQEHSKVDEDHAQDLWAILAAIVTEQNRDLILDQVGTILRTLAAELQWHVDHDFQSGASPSAHTEANPCKTEAEPTASKAI